MAKDSVRVGDDVRVASGTYEGKRGRVVLIREPDDILFEKGRQPLTGLLSESMALIEYQDVNAPGGTSQVGVPVRRLETR